jgi:type VI secretion system protein ImpC
MSQQEQSKAQAVSSTTSSEVSLLDQAIAATKQTERETAEEMIRALVSEANKGQVSFDKNTIHTIKNAIASIDKVVSKQLAAVMHHERFQKLEGTWRGLHYLCKNSETNDMLKIKTLNCSKRELAKDLSSASGFDQSSLWNAIYEQEFGMPGGQPYGALVGDYEFENHPEDIKLLEDISGIASGAFAPFITAPSPKLFGLETWQGLPKLVDLRTTFDSKEYAKWKSFRDSEDARFVVMTMPRTLARYPYGANTQRVDEFGFEELPLNSRGESVAVSHDNYCWMNTAYVHAARLTAAFAETSWCTAIRGRNSGGAVEGLPTYAFRGEDGDTDLNCPTEVPITDRREKELSDLGFLPLSHYKNTDYAVFFGGQTTQKPKKYDTAAATENAAISARLPYIMASSRIAHYLKVMVRDHIGSFKEASDMEDLLNRWVMQYVSADSSPSESVKAKYPLADASITVTEIPGSPGSYNAIALLRPWLQLEELNTSVRMVARIDKK